MSLLGNVHAFITRHWNETAESYSFYIEQVLVPAVRTITSQRLPIYMLQDWSGVHRSSLIDGVSRSSAVTLLDLEPDIHKQLQPLDRGIIESNLIINISQLAKNLIFF